MKTQTRKIGVAGGFFNQLMGNNQTEPQVGEGATILHFSDRSAYDVIWISDDGMECKIQRCNCKWVGTGYGDETYEYSPDPEGAIKTLRWNPKRNSWDHVYTTVQFFKAMAKRMFDEHGWTWQKHLPVTREEIWNEDGSMNLIDGITKEYEERQRVSIIFGTRREYRDPSF